MKHAQYAGDLSRHALIDALINKEEEMIEILDRIARDGGDRTVAFIGRQLNLGEFGHVIVHHEALHQGQWSLYASLAGFETPPSWRLNWGL